MRKASKAARRLPLRPLVSECIAAAQEKQRAEKALSKSADNVANWMFGDYGPFGWNDPCRFQATFNKSSKKARYDFVVKVTAKIQRMLLEKV